MTKTNPPRNELPDYFCGRLIYQDDDDDACQWVVYDGDKKQRFTSRKAAEQWCVKHAYNVTRDDVGLLFLAHSRVTSAHNVLREIAPRFCDEHLRIETLSVQLRRIADEIDTITSKHL